MRADVDDEGGPVAVEEPVARDAGLLPGNALEGELAAEAARRAGAGGVVPAPGVEDVAERHGGLLLVIDPRAAHAREGAAVADDLDDLGGLGADVQPDEA